MSVGNARKFSKSGSVPALQNVYNLGPRVVPISCVKRTLLIRSYFALSVSLIAFDYLEKVFQLLFTFLVQYLETAAK